MESVRIGLPATGRNGMSQKLPLATRAIATENRELLMRRWKMATSGEAISAHAMGRWFPGQKLLFELLSVLSKEETLRIANCNVPLFRVKMPLTLEPLEIQIPQTSDGIEHDSREECYLALLTRLDAVRRSQSQAEITYGFSSRHAQFLTRHTPRELQSLLGDLAVAIEPAVSYEFFVMSGMTNMAPKARTILAVASQGRL